MIWMRRITSYVTLVVLGPVTLMLSLPPRLAAQDREATHGQVEGVYDETTRADLSSHLAQDGEGQAAPDLDVDAQADRAVAYAARLPSAGGGAGATALPTAPGTVSGMGESFSAQLSTGTTSLAVPLTLPSARGRVQPRLDLSYSSAGGFGLAGQGWSVGVASISRQTYRGVPRYDDRSDFHPEQDRFLFGGSELVPICVVQNRSCTGAQAGEIMPIWANRWQYFRARVEGGFLRVFWSPDHRTWRIQAKDGTNLELGVPLDGTDYRGGLDVNPDRSSEIFRWYLTREYDSQGDVNEVGNPRPVNVIAYRYFTDAGTAYLSDIYDTPPAANPYSTDLSSYAHHTSLYYDDRPDRAASYRSGWRMAYDLRLGRVDVSSKAFDGPNVVAAPRELVRRYHMEYDAAAHTSLLVAVHGEGRCSAPVAENSVQELPPTTCPRLPPLRFAYQRVSGEQAPLHDTYGYAFEPFDTTVRDLNQSPPYSLDQREVGLVDANNDGLQDLLVTDPGYFSGQHGLFLNAADGQLGFRSHTKVSVQGPSGVDASVLRFGNVNVSAMDIDADGRFDFVHMPQITQYSVFSLGQTNASYQWRGRQVSTADAQDVKINFAKDAKDVRTMDVNGDGLVDFVYTAPTEIQTFFSLGRLPGGDGQFGHGSLTAWDSANLSTEPVRTCAPWSAQSLRFSDPDVRIADMNGDGLADLVRMRDGQLLYWPNRGNGFWGTGDRDDCEGGELGVDRHVTVDNAPRYGVNHSGLLMLGDVNGDGLADLVEVKATAVDIYLNENGEAFTDRATLAGVPFLPPASTYATLTDINGSGTPDILWGRAHEYRYLDLTGGVTPHLLVKTDNGLGRTHELTFRPATELMREAAAAGKPWQSLAPMATAVVVRSTVRDGLSKIGRPSGVYVTEYEYRDPVFEGRQREFRGFREAVTKQVGDSNSPTLFTRSLFHLGECDARDTPEAPNACAPEERWRDNVREPLKGLPIVTESFNEQGIYHSTSHTTHELRQLYTGLDGRRVTVSYPVKKDTYLYDTATFDRAAADEVMSAVEVRLADQSRSETVKLTLRSSAGRGHVRSTTSYDNFGSVTQVAEAGCMEGCPNGTDEVIRAHSEYTLPPGDESGWLWRERSSYVDGSVHAERRQEVSHTYSPQGNRLQSWAILRGTLALDRSHATGGAVAPAPSNQSGGSGAATSILLTDNFYDAFGHIERKRGPSGAACVSSVVDAPYAQLTVASSSYVGAAGSDGCGQTILTQQLRYDRGLEVVTGASDHLGQPARFTFDGLGRLTTATFAHPSTPGALAAQPTAIVSYDLPQDASSRPYSIIRTRVQDGSDANQASYRDSYVFLDGLGRNVASAAEADPSAGDGGDWVLSGRVEYNAKSDVRRACSPTFFSGDVFQAPWIYPAASDCRTQDADAFGRTVSAYRFDGLLETYQRFHALSADAFDAADMEAGPRQNTYHTAVLDGHGRSVALIARVRNGSQLEEHVERASYLPTGEVERVTQQRAGSADTTRWLRYDSLGRVVLNAEPNTSLNFSPDLSTPASHLRAIRYAYNDAGQLVGTSDARGCGTNYHYDAGGRLVAEDYSPCEAQHAPYSVPNLSTGDGTEVFIRYDSADPQAAGIVDGAGKAFPVDTSRMLGRLASISDRGMKSIPRYDVLGRGNGVAVRVAKPGAPSAQLSTRYAPRWYTREVSLDAAGRPTATTTGATTGELLGADGTSRLTFEYAKHGGVRRVAGSYGTLLASARHKANGELEEITMGDAAATRRAFTYDVNHRIKTVQSYRSNIPLWTSAPTGSSYVPPTAADATSQMLLEDYEYEYDRVNNIIGLADYRDPEDWPAAVRPVSRTFEYDDLYRMTKASYAYDGAPAAWQSPFAMENVDSERGQPMPHLSFAQRVASQSFRYDHLGNMVDSDDDAHAFWDRSTGARTYGATGNGPHQLRSASNRASASSSERKGDLDVRYDASGQIVDLVVRRDGLCLPEGSSCWQRFHYDWDEIGNITRARRWDLTQAGDERPTLGSLPLDSHQAEPPSTSRSHWYRADSCEHSNATGRTICHDKQAGGIQLANGSPSQQPAISLLGLNGKPALVSGATTNSIVAYESAQALPTSKYTVSFAGAVDGAGLHYGLWGYDTPVANGLRDRNMLYAYSNGNTATLHYQVVRDYGDSTHANESIVALQAPLPVGTPFIVTVLASATATELYLNGRSVAVGPPSIPIQLGASIGAGPPKRIGELVMYRDALEPTGELARLHRYLGDRYAIPINTATLPARSADADLRYVYSGTERVIKTAADDANAERHTLYVFDSLEVRGSSWNTTTEDYRMDAANVSVRLQAGAVTGRVIHRAESMPSLASNAQHLFLSFADHIGSTTFTIDHASGELVEYNTYQAYGGIESDYRPGRWASYREPYKFGGKEEDIEVGLMYFGARYYSPYAAVWLSPDPVTIHELDSDRNPYGYVGGSPLMNTDPDGRYVLASLLIAAAVAAVVAAAASATAQGVNNGWSNIDWGIKGVAGSAIVGFAAGLVGGAAGVGVSAVVGGTLGAVTGGVVGGAAGGGTGYLVSSAVQQSTVTGSGFGKAVAIGAVSGLVSGGLGATIGSGWWQAGVGGLAGTGAGTGMSMAMGGSFDATDFAISMGGGLAGAFATRGAVETLRPQQQQRPDSRPSGNAPGGAAGHADSRAGPHLVKDGRWWNPHNRYRLSATAKLSMEPIFRKDGYDLNRVRVSFGPMGKGTAGFTVRDQVVLSEGHWLQLAGDPTRQLGLLTHEITHSVQYARLGIVAFHLRYWPEFRSGSANYSVPLALKLTAMSAVDVVDPAYTLDQIAERMRMEVDP